jgi:ABC-type Fe3+/spermidine/putrescine transport system ATPase subunit
VADFVGAANRLAATVAGGTADAYELTLAADGRRLTAPGCPGLEAGSTAAVILRPEALTLGAHHGDELVGDLLDASFLGSQTVYTISVEHCGEITVAESRPDAPVRTPGEHVRIGFAGEDAWVVPA